MRWLRAAGLAAAAAAAMIWACGSPGQGGVGSGHDAGTSIGDPDSGIPDTGVPDASVDAGPDGGGDAGPDGGTDAGHDGGTAWTPPPPIVFPAAAGWSFLGPQNNGPHDVYQVSADEGGNIWVAGGEDGLFLLRPGATKFERFTIADGLHPYGYLNGDQAKFLGVPNGTPADPSPSLSATPVIAVEGGPAGVVFVGYQGKGYPNGADNCESNWDTDHKPGPLFGDPAVYKSGDADRVTLKPDGTLSVVHYDIFSGPGLVGAELQGREKLCSILRIVWNSSTNDLWFGGNHGFAWGDPNYAGDPTCDGQWACSGNAEHSHPAVNGSPAGLYLTGDYRGISVDPATGDVWFGGLSRTTRFHWNAFGGGKVSRFYAAAELTEGFDDVQNPPACPSAAQSPCYIHNRMDIWPDAKAEGFFPGVNDRTDDIVFGIAGMPDGSAYVGSGYLGLRHIDGFGTLLKDETSRLGSTGVGAIRRDPLDGSIWVGNRYAGGIDRLDPSDPKSDRHYALSVFGNLANMGIEDIRMMGSGPSRKVLVGFRQSASTAGFVAIYSGN